MNKQVLTFLLRHHHDYDLYLDPKTGLLLAFSHSLNNMLSVWQEGSNRRMPFFDINWHC